MRLLPPKPVERGPRVTIWISSVGDVPDTHWAKLRAQLGLSARQRLQQIRSVAAAREFCLGRALLREALDELDCGPAEIIIGPYGRPELTGASSLPSFNIAHSDGLVAVAVTFEGIVGLDVEAIRRDGAFPAIAPLVLQPREREWLTCQPEHLRGRAFFGLWTLKEAYAKAQGRGLGMDFTSFGFHLDAPLAPPRLELDDEVSSHSWRFRHIDLHSDFSAAVALCSPQQGPIEVSLRRCVGSGVNGLGLAFD